MEEKYWQEVPEAQYPILRGQQKCDVAIVGGGLVGVTLAWMLTRQGVHTALVEAKTLGCGAASGCTGKVTAQLEETYERVMRAQGHEAAQLLCEMQRDAVKGVVALAKRTGTPMGLASQTVHVSALAPDQVPAVESLLRLEQSIGLPVAWETDHGDCPVPSYAAIRLERQALLEPLAYLHALAAQASEGGCAIFTNSPVTSLEPQLVLTRSGSLRAQIIVLCTGTPIHMKQLPLLAMLEQRTAMLAILEGTPTFTGSYLENCSEGVTLRPIPGGALVVGDLGITGSKCLRTHADAFTKTWRQFFPDARLTGSWVRQDVYSRDGMPLVGPLEKRDSHLLVATGLSGWGLTGSYLAARLLCRNILGRSQPEARFFLPHRSYAKKFAVMLPGALREAGAMAAMVFHRDMPKCTHMGCRLRYFPQAQRWECPCHGSAFSILGEVRAAPAAEDASISPRQRRQR